MKLLNQIRFLPYRVASRIGTADISRVFGIAISDLQAVSLEDQFSFEEITCESIRELIEGYPHFFSDGQAAELACDNVFCFVTFHKNKVAAFAWLATGDVAAEFNHNGDLRAGLPVHLPPDTGFVYNVFVMPDHRGKRLYSAIMRELASRIKKRGVTRLILTTDTTNASSLKALHRMGFHDLGKAWLLRIGPFSMARYPTSPVFGTVRFGKYIGDRRSRNTVA